MKHFTRFLSLLLLASIVLFILSSCSGSATRKAQSIQDTFVKLKQSGSLPTKVTLVGEKYGRGNYTYDTPWGKRESISLHDGTNYDLILLDSKNHEYEAAVNYVDDAGAKVVGAPENSKFLVEGTAFSISEASSLQISRGVKFYRIMITNATVRKP